MLQLRHPPRDLIVGRDQLVVGRSCDELGIVRPGGDVEQISTAAECPRIDIVNSPFATLLRKLSQPMNRLPPRRFVVGHGINLPRKRSMSSSSLDSDRM